MRITRPLAAAAVLAVAACGQRPAAAPAPVAERDFEYVASNGGQSACAVSYRKKSDTASVSVGQVAPGQTVTFTVRQPARGVSTVLRAHCGEKSYTHDLRPGRTYVALTQQPRMARQAGQCRANTGYQSRDPECRVPEGSERNAVTPTRRGDPRDNGQNGGAGRTDPTVVEPPKEP